MWQEFGADGTLGRLIGYLPEQPVLKGLLGICFSSELDAKQFPYGIGVEYDGRSTRILRSSRFRRAPMPCS